MLRSNKESAMSDWLMYIILVVVVLGALGRLNYLEDLVEDKDE